MRDQDIKSEAPKSIRSQPLRVRRQPVAPAFPDTVPPRERPLTKFYSNISGCTVLVINSSQDMAKEITLQLQLKLPGCAIVYAPTIELAGWLLRTRKIDLVVSSAILPDGSVHRLSGALQSMAAPPDVVVVGDLPVRNAEALQDSGYEFATVRRFKKSEGGRPGPAEQLVMPMANPLQERISSLGADLRNDLNNPLQEIVAMVFVAKHGAAMSDTTNTALDAIGNATTNLARVVSELEEKIRKAVTSPAI